MLTGTAREAAAEFLGTFFILAFGAGVVAQTVLSKDANGSYLAINIGWGLGVMLGVYASAGVSGAHLNPAVTLALAVHRGFPWRKVTPYVLAQTAGAFAAAALVFLTYREAFAAFDGGVRAVEGATATAGIFATYPQPFLSLAGGFVDQMVGTALLMAGVLAMTDTKNAAPARVGDADARGRAGRGHRRGVRVQRRLCHQPRARLRAAAVHRHRGLGPAVSSPPGAGGGGCRWWHRAWARSSGPGPTTRSWATTIPRRPRDEHVCAGARPGHHVEPRDRVRPRPDARCPWPSRSSRRSSRGRATSSTIRRRSGARSCRPRATRSPARASPPRTSPPSASPTSARRRFSGTRPPASRWPTPSSGRAASRRRSAIG